VPVEERLFMSTITRRNRTLVVEIDKPLRQDEIDYLMPQIESAMQSGVPQLVIDLSATPLIDGQGLEWLEALDDLCGELGGCVRLCGAGELCSDILRVTGMDQRLERFETLPQAMTSFV